MSPPATLSRSEFNQACQELVRKYSSIHYDLENKYIRSLQGWTWVEDTRIAEWGQLTRTSVSKAAIPLSEYMENELFEEIVEAPDDSNASQTVNSAQLHMHECIVWHPTYMVPAYYFQVYDSSGSPASLPQIMSTNRFQHKAFTTAAVDVSRVALQPQQTNNAQFPLLSQGDHPILGIPHWYFHPCETSVAVTEILAQELDANTPLRWLEAWFTVLSTAIDLR